MDLKLVFVELSYHEDLFNNTASGYVMIGDSMGYIESMKLVGNEFLRMTYSKDGETGITDKLFRVYKVDKRQLESNMNTESYCLYFCSEEVFISEQYKISKSYQNQTISYMINDLLTNELKVPSKKISYPNVFEPTYGTYSFVIPTIKAFDAINWLSNYARPSADKLGSDMLLYENKFGYNYRSLQSLILSQPYANYSYSPKNITTAELDKNIFTVLTYEILNSFDSLKSISSGEFANQLVSIDPLTRRKQISYFDYAFYQNNSQSLNGNPVTNNYTNRKGDQLNQTSRAMLKLVFSNFNQKTVGYIQNQMTDSVSPDIFAETYIPYRTAQLQLTNHTRIRISVPGDSNLTVGMVIHFSLPSLNPIHRDGKLKSLDEYYSGKYLISAVRHMFSVNEYKTVLEIVKDSVSTPYASPSVNSTLWQNTVQGNY